MDGMELPALEVLAVLLLLRADRILEMEATGLLRRVLAVEEDLLLPVPIVPILSQMQVEVLVVRVDDLEEPEVVELPVMVQVEAILRIIFGPVAVEAEATMEALEAGVEALAMVAVADRHI